MAETHESTITNVLRRMKFSKWYVTCELILESWVTRQYGLELGVRTGLLLKCVCHSATVYIQTRMTLGTPRAEALR